MSPTGWGCREGQSCDPAAISWANGAAPLPAGQNPELQQPTSVDPMFVKFLAIHFNNCPAKKKEERLPEVTQIFSDPL